MEKLPQPSSPRVVLNGMKALPMLMVKPVQAKDPLKAGSVVRTDPLARSELATESFEKTFETPSLLILNKKGHPMGGPLVCINF